MRLFGIVCIFAAALPAEELPVITGVELQPLAAQVERVAQSLEMLGEPLPATLVASLRVAKKVDEIQKTLDRYCLAGININPESRVKVQQGEAKPELVEQGWRSFLVKVHNEAGVTATLDAQSPNAIRLHGSPEGQIAKRWLDIIMFNKQPMRERLSGLEVEYRIIQLYSRDAGRREAKISFDVGQGTQDLGFRNEVDILFAARPATKVKLMLSVCGPGYT